MTLAIEEAAAATVLARPPGALYVHVPFCISVCPYCDFVVVAGSAARGPRSRIAEFVDALTTELELRADDLDARFGPVRPAMDSLYLGGGTPSLVAAPTIAAIVDTVRRRYGLAPGAEVTVEANPGPNERGNAAALRDAGVTRLSIGAQSLDAAELRRLGRRHAPEDVARTVQLARTAGIGSISLDLLYDIPGGSPGTWATTLDVALALEPDHLSLYALTLDDPDAEGLTGPSGDHLPTSRGARRWRDDARADQDDDRAAAMYELADHRLRVAGYEWYELSNWARPGHRSRHNLVYWLREPYEAVGPGAHAFDGSVRRWNAARLDGYLAALTALVGERPALPPGGFEAIGERAAAGERAILALRTVAGISSEQATEVPLRDVLPWALETGLLEPTGDRFVLTLRGRLLSNELFARIL